MTQDEFQERYHAYQTYSREMAEAEAQKANEEGIDGNHAVAIELGNLGWCLMLKSATDALIEMGVI